MVLLLSVFANFPNCARIMVKIIFLIISICVSAASGDELTSLTMRTTIGQGDFIVDSDTSVLEKTNYLSEIRSPDIRDEVHWDGGTKPPLGATKAVSLAARYLEDHFHPNHGPPGLPLWMLDEVAIHEYYDTKLWYYKITLTPSISGGYNWPPVKVFVTMSGKVVPLRTRRN